MKRWLETTGNFVLLSMLLAITPARSGTSFELISVEQAQLEEQAKKIGEKNSTLRPQVPIQRRGPAGPTIRVISPSPSAGALKSPFRVELQFEQMGNAKIVPSTFRVIYGSFLRKDVTSVVVSNAAINEKGVVAENATVPKGDFRLYLSVADELGRTGQIEWLLKVID